MKTILIKEHDKLSLTNDYTLDLSNTNISDCCDCWTCWLRTPGKCAYKDLNEFYHEYITADKAVFFANVKHGFVSGNLKTLFDRMIPLYLPYITFKTGESRHLTRYDKYPDIYFYYDGEFSTPESRKVYEDYIYRVFDQFYSKKVIVKPISEYREGDIK